MRLAEKIFELSNVVEDLNLPAHLPNHCSDTVGARGPLGPAAASAYLSCSMGHSGGGRVMNT